MKILVIVLIILFALLLTVGDLPCGWVIVGKVPAIC